ncbi:MULTISPECIES: hypothetical protein [Acinetobacter]|jgi:hypothetical protein|uniref:Uncharacterized protein n=2 Tax=Acinetobacter TaxID=469 RepID=N8YRE8_ACIBZ|nr:MULTISPECIES: hypothetical protein [Acinetobacter]MDN5414007.1 hypothetical protein [Lactococcus raffinolactis]ENV23894.1 hypothetical protein F963_00084 [Acinetobacter bereziniae NIPH 3]MCU4419534.1 hypothetical protein [Acinetobacter bereziniae]MDN5434938.1 hypothetical protein [Acinetobacter sp.]PZT84157.1 MAG: hypothetical protein DI627_16695 [Acinetobacter sp.]
MNSDAIWTETEESRLKREDEVRMQELRRLFDLMDEREHQQIQAKELEEALNVLSWVDVVRALESCLDCIVPQRREMRSQSIDRIEQHRKWLKAFRSAMPYLAKMLLVTDASFLIRMRSTLDRYAEISYPNLLVMIQPKLQTLNSIEA